MSDEMYPKQVQKGNKGIENSVNPLVLCVTPRQQSNMRTCHVVEYCPSICQFRGSLTSTDRREVSYHRYRTEFSMQYMSKTIWVLITSPFWPGITTTDPTRVLQGYMPSGSIQVRPSPLESARLSYPLWSTMQRGCFVPL